MARISPKDPGLVVHRFPTQSVSGAALSSDQPQDEEEHHRADKRRDDSVDPKVDMKGDVGRLENPTADERAAAVAREAKYPVQAFSTKPEARRRRWCCIAAWFAPDCRASPSRQGPLFLGE